jgi:hypothetical protein
LVINGHIITTNIVAFDNANIHINTTAELASRTSISSSSETARIISSNFYHTYYISRNFNGILSLNFAFEEACNLQEIAPHISAIEFGENFSTTSDFIVPSYATDIYLSVTTPTFADATFF